MGFNIFQGGPDGLDSQGKQLAPVSAFQRANPTTSWMLDAKGQAAADRQAPMLGAAATYGGATIDPTQQDQFRGRQMSLADALTAQANGQGPSVAQGQFQQATDRNLANAMALGSSQRGLGAGAALRGIQSQQAGISQQAAADSGMLRAQEQMAAQNQLGALLAGGRGQDIGLASGNAQMAQQAGLANQAAQNQFATQNQQAGLQQSALNDKLQQYYSGASLATQDADRQAMIEREKLRQQQYATEQQASNQQFQQGMGIFNGALGGLSSLGGFLGKV